MAFHVVIPARWGSSRFPGKVLVELGGRSLVEWAAAAGRASGASSVRVATDSALVGEHCDERGICWVLTASEHRSGTDRVAEVARLEGWADEAVVVNLQCDAPLTPPADIAAVAAAVIGAAPIATLATEGDHGVRVVTDRAGRALYFSRAPIPARAPHSAVDPGRAAALGRRHLGLYAYRVDALRTWTSCEPCELEQVEQLEQLRALWLGLRVAVVPASAEHGPDIDEPADLARAHAWLAAR